VPAEPLPPSSQPPAVSRQKAQDILRQAQFRSSQPSVVQRAGDWLAAHLIGGFAGGSAWVVLFVFVAVIVAVIVWQSRTVQRDPARPLAAVVVESPRRASDWLAEAEAHEAAGRWKDGLRCRYRALVADLVARRMVRDLPGRTTGEHRADIAESTPAAVDDFDAAAALFERAWYGDRPTGPDESARFGEHADRVVR
jgi:hypothetical protein